MTQCLGRNFVIVSFIIAMASSISQYFPSQDMQNVEVPHANFLGKGARHPDAVDPAADRINLEDF